MTVKTSVVSALAVCGVVACFSPAGYAHGQPVGGCGPDQATAVEDARRHTPHDQFTQGAYDPVPVATNYDPCANLSTVLLSGDRTRAEAPIQSFLFNRGRFVGTAFESRPYTTLDAAASTKDMVVLDFVTGRSCTACGDGRTQTVRYVWTGGSVQNLDPRPPEAVTDMS